VEEILENIIYNVNNCGNSRLDKEDTVRRMPSFGMGRRVALVRT
jgi:hypothetical protein